MGLDYPHLQFTEGFWWGRPEGDHVRQRGAILSLQAIDGCEAVFNLGETLRRGVDVGGVVAQRESQIFDDGAGAGERSGGVGELRVEARKLFE